MNVAIKAVLLSVSLVVLSGRAYAETRAPEGAFTDVTAAIAADVIVIATSTGRTHWATARCSSEPCKNEEYFEYQEVVALATRYGSLPEATMSLWVRTTDGQYLTDGTFLVPLFADTLGPSDTFVVAYDHYFPAQNSEQLAEALAFVAAMRELAFVSTTDALEGQP